MPKVSDIETLKAWCHWKLCETDARTDDTDMAHVIQGVIAQAERVREIEHSYNDLHAYMEKETSRLREALDSLIGAAEGAFTGYEQRSGSGIGRFLAALDKTKATRQDYAEVPASTAVQMGEESGSTPGKATALGTMKAGRDTDGITEPVTRQGPQADVGPSSPSKHTVQDTLLCCACHPEHCSGMKKNCQYCSKHAVQVCEHTEKVSAWKWTSTRHQRCSSCNQERTVDTAQVEKEK